MSAEAIANGILMLAGLYVAAGFGFAVYFVTKGVARIDPVAKEGSKGFRLLIFPGVVALWPLLAHRIHTGVTTPPTENSAHIKAHKGASQA